MGLVCPEPTSASQPPRDSDRPNFQLQLRLEPHLLPNLSFISNLWSLVSPDKTGIDQLMAAHAGLEVFDVTLGNEISAIATDSGNVEREIELVDTRGLVASLRKHHAKSLRRMTLHLTKGPMEQANILQPLNRPLSAVSLRAFTNLETLCIHAYTTFVHRSLGAVLRGSISPEVWRDFDMDLLNILPQTNIRRPFFNDNNPHQLVSSLKALASAIEFQGQFARLEEVRVPLTSIHQHHSLPFLRALPMVNHFTPMGNYHIALMDPEEEQRLERQGHEEAMTALHSRFAHIGVKLLTVDGMDKHDHHLHFG